jgi:hypothetical protein
MLQALYEKMDANPVMEFELEEDAKKLFVDYYNHCQRLKFDHPKQGMRAMLGKAAEKVGRVATILHCIHAAHLGLEVSRKIPVQQVAAAIKWVEYTTQQALSINIEVCSPDALESNLAKIISLAERKGGTVSARDVSKFFTAKYRPTAQEIREWFTKLATLNYGDITTQGQSLLFSLTKLPPLPPISWEVDTVRVTSGGNVNPSVPPLPPPSNIFTPNLCSSGGKWGQSGGNTTPTPKSLPDMDLNPSGGNGGNFSPSAGVSQPSMPSCTTEPVEFADEALAKMLADEIRKAIAENNRKDAAEVIKRVANSAPRVRQFFFKSFTKEENLNIRLLRDCGLTKGMRVECVGKDMEQYAGEVLTVESINSRNELACLRPDGKGYTTWLKSEDLQKL